MFVHRKKHRSGHVSIIVMDKSSGKLREVKNFGVAKSDSEADELYFEAKQWIRRYGGQLEMDFIDDEVKLREQEETTRVLSNIDSLLINGHRLILDQVYDSIGFNEIPDEILFLLRAKICFFSYPPNFCFFFTHFYKRFRLTKKRKINYFIFFSSYFTYKPASTVPEIE